MELSILCGPLVQTHVLKISLFSSVTSTGHQWRTCQFQCSMAICTRLHGAGGGHGVVKSVSDYLVRDIHTSDMLEVVFQGSGHARSSLHKGAQMPVLLMGWGPSTALSSSSRIIACLLEFPPCSLIVSPRLCWKTVNL